MQDLTNSMVKFSAALTMFGLQQVQNMLGAVTDSQGALDKFKAALDSVTDALTSQVDETNQSTLSSVSKLGTDIVDRTMSAVNVPAMDPTELAKTTSDIVRKATDSMTDIMARAASSMTPASSGEPKAASEALAN